MLSAAVTRPGHPVPYPTCPSDGASISRVTRCRAGAEAVAPTPTDHGHGRNRARLDAVELGLPNPCRCIPPSLSASWVHEKPDHSLKIGWRVRTLSRAPRRSARVRIPPGQHLAAGALTSRAASVHSGGRLRRLIGIAGRFGVGVRP